MGEECCKEHDNDECCEGHGEMPHHMLLFHLADDAWAALMMDKMKKLWEEKRGPHMDKAAKVAVDFSMDFWNAKMAGKEVEKSAWEKFEKDLEEAMK